MLVIPGGKMQRLTWGEYVWGWILRVLDQMEEGI